MRLRYEAGIASAAVLAAAIGLGGCTTTQTEGGSSRSTSTSSATIRTEATVKPSTLSPEQREAAKKATVDKEVHDAAVTTIQQLATRIAALNNPQRYPNDSIDKDSIPSRVSVYDTRLATSSLGGTGEYILTADGGATGRDNSFLDLLDVDGVSVASNDVKNGKTTPVYWYYLHQIKRDGRRPVDTNSECILEVGPVTDASGKADSDKVIIYSTNPYEDQRKLTMDVLIKYSNEAKNVIGDSEKGVRVHPMSRVT